MNLPAHWEGARVRERGTISDLSMTGCFMLTAGETARGEPIRVAVELPEGVTMRLGGEVVYYTEEIGFAVRFTTGEAADKKMLAGFLKKKQAGDGDTQPA